MDLVSFWLVVVSLLLFIVYAFMIAYYRKGWNRCPEFPTPDNFEPHQKVSIVIPARNEQEHIEACLQSLRNQTYPSSMFEVLVVDDHSEDNTAELIQAFPASNVRLIRLKEFVDGKMNAYKKKAIDIAIQKSTGDWIITTDADCIASPDWIRMMMAFQQYGQYEFIAAPVKIQAKDKILDVFQSLDFLTLQGITGAAVYRNFHVMCNGANLCYSKKAFFEVKGFENIDGLASGDDMLLMQKIRARFPGKIGYLKSKDAVVTTDPARTWKAFWQQRIRWSSKADKYDDKTVFRVLLLVYFFNFFLLALFLGSIFNPDTLIVALLLLFSKIIVEFPFVNSVATFFHQQRFMIYFPFLQPLHMVYVVLTGFLGKFGSYEWKGRKVK